MKLYVFLIPPCLRDLQPRREHCANQREGGGGVTS